MQVINHSVSLRVSRRDYQIHIEFDINNYNILIIILIH